MSTDGISPTGFGTEHTLIEGLLAVRMGLIGESAFRRALDDWQADPCRPFATILRDHGCLDSHAAPVLEAASRLLLEHHGGDTQRAVEALAQPLSPNPPPTGPTPDATTAPASGHTPPTTADLPPTDNATPPRQPSSESVPPEPIEPRPSPSDAHTLTFTQADQPTHDLGFHLHSPTTPLPNPSLAYTNRYQILKLHAKGNLGEVFCAQDHDLGREVALKQIQARHAEFANRREQFEIEARITGGLEHPGIAPVYSLGRGPDGRPFYTMRLIRGKSLRLAITEFHSDPQPLPAKSHLLRALVRRLITVCETLAYAHSRGVLHRDIKPSNIMLGDYGETLLVDWGLAKAQGFVDDPSTASAEGPLQLSDSPTEASIPGIKGTIPYMSPEQARGETLDTRSDIYSLGATLYSLLTGQLPYEGTDSQQVLEAVRRAEPRYPRSIRRDIPPALDAICRKAMAPHPANRYPSARALADDLTRWIDDEPVLAYPEPWIDRLRRWARKHPAATGVATTSVAILALASIPLGLLLRGEATARAAADQFNQQLIAQRKQTERQFHQTRRLVDDFTELVGSNIMLLPGSESFRRLVVDKAAQRYTAFLEERPDDPEIVIQAAQVFRLAANSNRALEVDPAPDGTTAHLYNRAFDLASRAVRHDSTLAYRPALTLADFAEWHRLQGRLELADNKLRQALALADSIPPAQRTTLGNHLVRGAAHSSLGGIYFERGLFEAARNETATALKHLTALTAETQSFWVYRLLELQARRLALEIDAAPTGQLDPARVETLIAESANLLEKARGEFDARFFHCSTLLLRARTAVNPDQNAQRADQIRTDIQNLLSLFQAHPAIPFLRRATAEAYLQLAEVQLHAGRLSGARQNAAQGLRLARANDHPENLALVATALNLQAQLTETDKTKLPEARDLYEQALNAIDSAIAGRPQNALFRRTRDEIRARLEMLPSPSPTQTPPNNPPPPPPTADTDQTPAAPSH